MSFFDEMFPGAKADTAYERSMHIQTSMQKYIKNVQDFISRHSLVVNASLFNSTFASKQPGVPALPHVGGDPVRSNLFGYWYIDHNSEFPSVKYRTTTLQEIVNLEPNTPTIQTCVSKGGENYLLSQYGTSTTAPQDLNTNIYECSEEAYLSKKYKSAGFDITLGPPKLLENAAAGEANAFNMRYEQHMVFKLDYSRMVNLLQEQEMSHTPFEYDGDALGLKRSWAEAIFYGFIASLFVDPNSKQPLMDMSSKYSWAATSKGDTDESYVGYLDHAKTFQKNNQTFVSELKVLFGNTIEEYFSRISLGEMHHDYSFEVSLPMSEQAHALYNAVAMSSGQFGKGGGKVGAKSVYNFYSPLYENGFNKYMNLSEHVLPNIYAIMKYVTYHNADTKTSPSLVPQNIADLRDHLGLDGLIPIHALKGAFGLNKNARLNLPSATNPKIIEREGPLGFGQYFDTFGNALSSGNVTDINIAKAKRHFGHVFMSAEDLTFMQEANEYKTIFPMYADISFNTPVPGEFCSLLKDSGDVLEYMKILAANFFVTFESLSEAKPPLQVNPLTSFGPDQSFNLWGGRFLNMSYCTEAEIPAVLSDGPQTGYTFAQEKSTRVLDILHFWQDKSSKFEGFKEAVFQDQGMFFGTNKKTTDAIANFKEQINKIVFIGKLKKFIKKHFRSYQDVMIGKKAYTETVFFRIEKRAVSGLTQGEGAVLQNFWLPNLPGFDIMNYIDTQVKYGRKYKYNVYAYNIVVGSKYIYKPKHDSDKIAAGHYLDKLNDITGVGVSKLETSTFLWSPEGSESFYKAPLPMGLYEAGAFVDADLYSIMAIVTEPTLLMVEVPFYSSMVNMVDTPPLSPDMQISSYIGDGNTIKIDFNNQTGDVDLLPQPLDFGDEELFDSIRASQNREMKNFKGEFIEPRLRFKSDDYAQVFEIYRLDFKPSSYEDFFDNKLASVETSLAAGYEDFIDANRKYYYTFRCIDTHGHISNPSPVHEVEMVNEEGMIFLLTKIVDFEEEGAGATSLTKPLNRFIHIAPADFQMALKDDLLKEDIKSAHDLHLKSDYNVFGEGVDESLFDGTRKYKIRLTSKKTGRKIDLNIKCFVDHIPSEKKLNTSDVKLIKIVPGI